MSLDDLISLLLILVFVIVPFLGRALRRQRPQPTRRQSGTGASPAREPQRKPTPPTARPDSEAQAAFEQRLEEARRRVREASGGHGQASRRAPQGQGAPATTPAAPPGGLFSAPRPERQSRGAAAGSYSFLPRESETARALTTSRPLQVQRRLGKKRAKLSRSLLRLEQEDILRGFIWQQILNEPRSKQSPRRMIFRRP